MSIDSKATVSAVKQWLQGNQFDEKVQDEFMKFNGIALLGLSKDDIKSIVPGTEGLRLYSLLHPAQPEGIKCEACKGSYSDQSSYMAHVKKCTDPDAPRVKGLLASMKPDSWDIFVTLESAVGPPVQKVMIKLDGGCQAGLIIPQSIADSLGLTDGHCQPAQLKVVGEGKESIVNCVQSTVAVSILAISHRGTLRRASAHPYVYGDEILGGLPTMTTLKIGAPSAQFGIPVFRIEVPRL